VQLRQALNAAVERLTAARVPSPRMNAELLIMFMLGCDRAYLYAHPERELSLDEIRRYERSHRPSIHRSSGSVHHWTSGVLGLDLIVSPTF